MRMGVVPFAFQIEIKMGLTFFENWTKLYYYYNHK